MAANDSTPTALEHNVTCTRCRALVVDPIAAPCGDVQCAACFQEWLRHAGPCDSVTCPACRHSFQAQALVGTGICTALQSLLERLFPVAIAARRQQLLSGAQGSLSCGSAAGHVHSTTAAAAAVGISDGGESMLEASDESCHHMDDKPSQHYPLAPGGGSSGSGKRDRSTSDTDADDEDQQLLPAKRAMSDITPIPVKAAHGVSKTASASWPGQPHDVVLGMPLHAFTATWAAAVAHSGHTGVSEAAVWAATAAAFGALTAAGCPSPPAPQPRCSATAAGAAGGDAGPPLSQPWHSVEDTAARVAIARSLLVLLRARGLVRAVGEKLVLRAVQHMELVMYRRAATMEDYRDMATLEHRAVEVLEGMAHERRRQAAAATAMAATPSAIAAPALLES